MAPTLAQGRWHANSTEREKTGAGVALVSAYEGLARMPGIKKPKEHGSPGQKARKVLGEKLNRPSKPPPNLPRRKEQKIEPPARRVADEVKDL